MSSDGKIQTAFVYGGYIWVSSDYGATWAQKGSFAMVEFSSHEQ